VFINAQTKIYLLLGSPVSHSLSPLLQNTAFLNLDLNAVYLACDVSREKIVDAIKGIKALSVAGFNVTSPLKEAVIPFLDSLSAEAEVISSVNTVVNRNGMLYGLSTDGYGFIQSLADLPVDIVSDRPALVIGTGGAARAVALAMAKSSFSTILITGRDYDKASYLANLCQLHSKACCSAVVYSKQELKKVISNCSFIVYCLPVDSFTVHEALGRHPVMEQKIVLYDLRYSPAITPVMKKFQDCGGYAVNGSGMLFWQGVKAFEEFTGKGAPVKIMQEAFKNILERSR